MRRPGFRRLARIRPYRPRRQRSQNGPPRALSGHRPNAPDGQEVLGSDLDASATMSPEAAAKLEKLDKELGLTPCLILTVSENGFGKRTDVDQYRLQSRGGKGVINMRTTPKIGKVTGIQLVDDTTEMMVISQFGKIIRIDTKTVRAEPALNAAERGRATRPALSAAEGSASSTSTPTTKSPPPWSSPQDPKTNGGEGGTLLQ